MKLVLPNLDANKQLIARVLDIRKLWRIRAGITQAVRDDGCHTTRVRTDGVMQKVLLEAPFDPLRRQMNSVLLTVDLTKAVVDEAIERKDSIVVAYRMSPPYHRDFG
jgi:hypothetical protein